MTGDRHVPDQMASASSTIICADFLTAGKAARALLDRSRFDKTTVHTPAAYTPPNVQREPAFDTLRHQLITHFDVARGKREVRWLRCGADCRPQARGVP